MFIEVLDRPYGCCGKDSISVIEQLISEYYTIADDCIMTPLNKAYAYELFGKASEKEFNKVMNFQYLLVLLLYIYYEKQNELLLLEKGIITEVTTVIEWEEEYSLDCYRKTFSCWGCDIMPLFSVFGLDWINDPLDGIGYMSIQPGSTPKNRIS